MNKQTLIMIIIVFVSSTVMFGTEDIAKTEQELFHVWTPEPELATAIACQDNDFGCEHLTDPNKHTQVPLTTSVRTAICKITKKTFEDELYEGPTKYTDLFGPVYRIIIPDSNNLHLYVFQLKSIPWLSFRYYSLVLILYDTKNNMISSALVSLGTDFQTYCSRPWIGFQDFLGDSTNEILILTGEHRGTDADWMVQHILQIENGVNLVELGEIKTSIWHPFAFPDAVREERGGYIVRIIEKLDQNRFATTVSYSKSKQIQGEILLGKEVHEFQENTGIKRIDLKVDGETEDETKDYNEILMNGYYF